MSNTPAWKKILQSSLKENIGKVGPSATYASIATVKKNNTPAVRTVVMRGFAGEHHSEDIGWESDLLVVITDKTSDKVKEIEANPHTEINWYMNGTMEQFRIGGKITMVGRDVDPSKLEHLNTHMVAKDRLSSDGQKSLALQSFLKQSTTTENGKFNWQAERLRQFIQYGASMRAQGVHSQSKGKVKELDIKELDPTTGWFRNEQVQDLLEESFENFLLLVVEVTKVRHWSPSTGTQSML